MKNFRTTLMLAGILLLAVTARAQQTLVEFANDDDKSFLSGFRYAPFGNEAKHFKPKEDGSGDFANFKVAGGLPKRVALISFYSFDKGTTKKGGLKVGYTYTPQGTYFTRSRSITTSYTTDQMSSGISDAFFALSYDKLKSQFDALGMQLLLPDEFLTDDAKLELYKNFQPEGSSLDKIFKQDNDFMSRGSAKGFLPKSINSDNADRGTWQSYGKFAKDLGVDAVLIVMNEIEYAEGNFNLNKVGVYMFGPNPIAPVEGKKYYGKYYEGLCYEGAYLMIGKVIQKGMVYTGEGAILAAEKGKKAGEYFEGYEKLMDRFLKTTLGNLAAKKNN